VCVCICARTNTTTITGEENTPPFIYLRRDRVPSGHGSGVSGVADHRFIGKYAVFAPVQFWVDNFPNVFPEPTGRVCVYINES